jgi:hypothetical protein
MTRNYVPTKKLADLDLNSELNQFDLNLQLKRDKAISVADYRSERGEIVAALLGKAAAGADDKVCSAYAERLKACADRSNFYYGDDFIDNSTGELFSGFGNLFGCGLKLCQSCVARAAARNRNIARQVVDNTKLLKKEYYHPDKKEYVIERERYRFITLTMPEIEASLRITMVVQKRAWDLFRKLKFTKDYLFGYIKGIEFTVRNNGTYHDHIHLLAISLFIPEIQIKIEWTNCVKKAFNEFGFEFGARQANVNLQLVYSKAKPEDKGKIISYEDAITETCKYITKTKTWEEIPAEHLLEIARIRRWDRMFEVSGRFRQTAQKLNAERAAVVSSFVGSEATLIEEETLSSYYLDTDGIFDGSVSEASGSFGISEEISDKSSVKSKRISWRDVVKEQGLENYLQIFYRQVEFTRNLRKLRLIIKYPDANFTDLDGRAWDLAEIEAFAQRIASRGIELGI